MQNQGCLVICQPNKQPINNAIDSADGVEPVEVSEPASGFAGSIIIEKKKALEEAKRCQTGAVMWADDSELDQGNVGAAVCWKDRDPNNWKNTSVFLGKNKGNS